MTDKMQRLWRKLPCEKPPTSGIYVIGVTCTSAGNDHLEYFLGAWAAPGTLTGLSHFSLIVTMMKWVLLRSHFGGETGKHRRVK